MGDSDKSKKSRGHKRSHRHSNRDNASSSHASGSGSSTAANQGSSHGSSSHHNYQPQYQPHYHPYDATTVAPNQEEETEETTTYYNAVGQPIGYQGLPPQEQSILQSHYLQQPTLWYPWPGNSALYLYDGTSSRPLSLSEIEAVRRTRTEEELNQILRDFNSHGR